MVNTIYILDKDKRVVDILSNNGDNPISPFFKDTYSQHLATGAETYDFYTIANERTNLHCIGGNYVLFMYNRKAKMFQITRTEEEHREGFIVKRVMAEIGGLELINNVVRPMDMPSVNPTQFFNTILKGTGWALGLVDSQATKVISTKVSTLKNVYSLIQEHLPLFDIEIEFRVALSGNRIVGQYIDIHKKRIRHTRKRFEYGKNVSGIKREVNMENIITSVIGRGKGGIDFKSVEWLSDKPLLKPLNQDFLINPSAYEKWNKQGEQREGYYENTEVESPDELLLLSYQYLMKNAEPQFTYKVDVELIQGDEAEVLIGDEVAVIDNDFEPALLLSARVGQLDLSFTDHTKNKCTLTNFKTVKGGILSLDTIQAIIDGKFPISGNEIIDGTIEGDKIKNETITGVLIKADAIEAKHITADSIDTKHLRAGAITADKAIIADAAIKSAQIGNAQIGTAHIKEGAIDTAQINDAAINTAKIQDLAVGTAQIKDAAIDNAKIKELSADKITSGQINTDILKANIIEAVNASIGKIDADHIDVSSLVVDNIDAGKITTGTLAADRITSSVITAVNASIENAVIDQAKIGNLDASKITTGSLTADIIKAEIIKAINLSVETATIDSAKIGSLSADKITSGSIDTDRLTANIINAINLSADKISSDKLDIKQGFITEAMIGDLQVTTGKIGNLSVGTAKITDGAITNAKIENLAVDSAKIANASIDDAKIKSLNANKITAGTIDTGKITVSSTQGNLSIANNTLQIKDNQATPVVRVQLGQDSTGDYGLVVQNALGQKMWDFTGATSNGIQDGAIVNDKIKDNEITSSKLVIDEIWASEGFIANFNAQEINADKITTGQISSDLINLSGLVSFESLNPDLRDSFTYDPNADKTWIDGGNIYAKSITGSRINTRGFTATDTTGRTTFNIDEATGKTSMYGLVESGNYSNVEGQEAGYQLDPVGKVTLNDAILRGSVILPSAGITNEANYAQCNAELAGDPVPFTGANRQVRFWAGADFDNRCEAPFIVYSDGKVKATEGEFGGTFTGKLQIGNIHIEDTVNSKGYIDIRNNDETRAVIHLEEENSYINSNLAVGSNLFNINTTNGTINIQGQTSYLNGKYSTVLNNGAEIMKTSDGKGAHIQKYDGGTLVQEAQGTNTQGDFQFKRADAPTTVKVEGEMYARDKITMNNNIAIVARQDEGNSGFDYVVK